jgi:hypothetical protein
MSKSDSGSDPSPRDARRPEVAATAQKVIGNMEKVIIGKRHQITLTLVAYLCEGHVLLEDVPGVAKTMLARALAKSVGCTFKRIQCTPDLLPTDVTGVSVFNQKSAEFEFRPGPLFAQTVLADEVNRATPRTQSALLEAMAERRVTVDGQTCLRRWSAVRPSREPCGHQAGGVVLLPSLVPDLHRSRKRCDFRRVGKNPGRHQAHVHLDGLGAAQTLELLLLEHAEQLGLQLWRDVTHLVEKQCPPVRQLEAAALLGDGAGEGALFVAIQFALQEARGDGRTVQLDEGAALARAQVVNGAGDQLLAGAGFAPNEHRGACGGDRLHLMENAAEGGAIPDDLPEVVVGADFLLQVGVRFGELVPQRLDLLVALLVADALPLAGPRPPRVLPGPEEGGG